MSTMPVNTADLFDADPSGLAVCGLALRSFGKKVAFHGPIRTVRVHETNVFVKEALHDVEPGTVLVVDGGGSRYCALLGDRLAGVAAERGLSGFVIHGCVRDAAELASVDIGVVALGTNPRRSGDAPEGDRDVPVAFGGIVWQPGAYAYVDADAVVVTASPRHGAE